MNRIVCFLGVLIFFSFPVVAQNPFGSSSFYKGYTRSLKGGGFSYHSPEPEVTRSLLVRSVDSASFIEWETETVPQDLHEIKADFVWMFGMDANTELHSWRLYVNGNYCLTFRNPREPDTASWEVKGRNGASLSFIPVMLDKYNDPMGYAVLALPEQILEKGKPQVIRVIGESAGSNVWYMTFEAPVAEKLEIVQEEAVIRDGGLEKYAAWFQFVHLGTSVKGSIRVDGMPERSIQLRPGFNRFRFLLPISEKPVDHSALVRIDGKEYKEHFTLHPVDHWVIYLVQHAHTDIGYTRPQTEILPEHMRYIDYALDYCDLTDSFPNDARFRWTCETSWAVREFIRTRPQAQVDRLKKRISEGRIEVTGLFLNSSDLADEASTVSSLRPVGEFRKAGIPVRMAMQDDINGVPWCLPDYLSGCGIRYLSMGQNDTRALKPFDVPTTFWWESPSGKRILVNRPEHYMWGNQLGILTGIETFGQVLFLHLKDIRKRGYPYDHYAIHFSGYLTDNSPPSITASGLVRKWNENYVWPRLRLSTVSEFCEYMEKEHSTEMPVCRGAWPDWWMDGFGSAMMETAYARMAHEDNIANQGLLSMAVMSGKLIPERIFRLNDQLADDLAFYDEHTFGAAESISDPMIENSIVQWNEKAAYAWDAVKQSRIIREEAMGLLQGDLPRANVPTVTVFNTLNWARSGIAKVFIDHQIIPGEKKFTIVDDVGREIPVQEISARAEGSWYALSVKEVPPAGYCTYRIKVTHETRTVPTVKPFSGVFENSFYRLDIDTNTGAIARLFDKELGRNLIDSTAPYGLGQMIYERLGKNRHQLEMLKLDDYKRSVLSEVSVSGIREGSVWESVTIHGKMPECADPDGVTCEVRLFQNEKKIEFAFSMKKMPVTDPEGVYVSFPLTLPGGKLNFEVQGGTMVPGVDQLEGSASDWDGIQNFVSLKNKNAQIVFSSPEVPLVQLGGINLGRFARIAKPSSTDIYSWVLNNYWTTNFRASQEGELKWTYQLSSGPDTACHFAARFGWGERMPMPSRVLPAMVKDTMTPRKSFIYCWDNLSLVLVNYIPGADSKSIILQVRETDGKEVRFPLKDVLSSMTGLLESTMARSVQEVNAVGEEIASLQGWMTVHPYETRFIKLNF